MRIISAIFLLAVSAGAAADFLNDAEPKFLPVDEAFVLQPVETQDGKLTVAWRVTPEHFLYRTRLSFVSASPGLKLGKPVLPKGKPYKDELLGDTEIYDADLSVSIPATGSGTLKITYQGCAKKGICYPPQTRELKVSVAPARKA